MYAVVESAEAPVTSSLLAVVVSTKLAYQQWSRTEGQAVTLGSLQVYRTGTTMSLAENRQVHMLRKPIS